MQDIHTHLYWESYDADRKAVIDRAREAGVQEMIVVGTTVEESKKALLLAKGEEKIYASVGIHPNEFRETKEYSKNTKINSLLENLKKIREEGKEKVIAVGECGLDYSLSHGVITDSDIQYQKELFEAQLQLAEEFQLPVIIHCRAKSAETDEAYWDILEILQNWERRIPYFVLHCYMGSTLVTEKFLAIPNIYFSFTGNITYPVKNSIQGGPFDLQEVVKLVPLEKVFTETDCPFLAPQEYRGKRNEPAYVMLVASKIAALHGVSREEVDQITDTNFRKVFQGRYIDFSQFEE